MTCTLLYEKCGANLHKMFGLRAFLVQQNRPVRLSEQFHLCDDLCRSVSLRALFRTAARAGGRVGGGVDVD